MKIELSSSHEIPRLAEAYSQRDRLQIRDFLTDDSAESIFATLEQLPWGLAFNEGERVVQLSAADLAQLTRGEAERFITGVHTRARTGYQFLYAYYPLLTAYFTPGRPHLPIFDVYEFINSAPFLNFVRELTGLKTIRWADAHATLFRAGHFLKYHTDENASDRRVAAYVLNFTKGWGRDWGGFLQFFNDRYDVEEGLRPVFNALNIFTIPADHSVSMVSAYAHGSRYSITGWLREDDPPGSIGSSVPRS